MANLSFEIKTPQDFFQALLEQYEEYQANPLSSRHAILCAILCYHLIDWIKNTSEFNMSRDNIKIRINDNGLADTFDIIRDICDGSKHLILDRKPPKQVEDSIKYEGPYDDSYGAEYDTSDLLVRLKKDEVRSFENELEKAIQFWKDFFSELETKENQ